MVLEWNLQWFAIEGESDDDPNIEDEDTVEEDDVEEDQETEEEAEEAEDPKPAAEPEKKFTQEDLDRLIDQRLARERARQEEEQRRLLERQKEETQKKQLFEERYTDRFQQLLDVGYPEDAAKKTAERDVRREIEQEIKLSQLEQQIAMSEKMALYSQQKADVLSRVPLAAKYVQEIDAVSKNGAEVDFETAAYFVLGQKAAQGELINDIKTATEQRTLRDVTKRGRKTVEGNSQPGKTEGSLTPAERELARNLGISPKAWLAQKNKRKK